MKCLLQVGEFFLSLGLFFIIILVLKEWQEEDEDGGACEDMEEHRTD